MTKFLTTVGLMALLAFPGTAQAKGAYRGGSAKGNLHSFECNTQGCFIVVSGILYRANPELKESIELFKKGRPQTNNPQQGWQSDEVEVYFAFDNKDVRDPIVFGIYLPASGFGTFFSTIK